jgi:hypothetical protein
MEKVTLEKLIDALLSKKPIPFIELRGSLPYS